VTNRLTLGDLFGAGFRSLSKYTGTVLAVFVIQSLVTVACMLAMAFVFAQQFSHLPMFDDAVDGDLVSLVWCIRSAPSAFLAVAGIAFAAIVFWQLVLWFLVGGLVGVFSQLPEGRGDTARCFGASGATTYLTYARLWLCSLPGWVIALLVWGLGMGMVQERITYALTLPQLFGPLIIASLPALLIVHYLWTVADYARVELSLRHESHAPGVVKTYLRTMLWVLRRPLTLVHSGIGWIFFLLFSIAYAYLAAGHPMYGVEGAVTLFFVRQGVALIRMAIHVSVLGGQIELGRARPLPPRRVEVKVDSK